MALVARGNSGGFFLTLSLIDKQEDQTTKEYELNAADYAAAVAARANIIAAFEAMSDLEIVGVTMSERLDENAIVVPAVGSVSDKLTMSFRLDGTSEKAPHVLPAPKDAIMTAATGAGNNILDFGNADVLVYTGLFLSGGDAFISDGESVDSLVKAVRSR